MAKKKFLIAMDEELHRRLKIKATEAGVHLGDAIGVMMHSCENRVDLAKLTDSLPYQDEWQDPPTGIHSTSLYQTHMFAFKDQAAIYRIEDERGLPKSSRPFAEFGRKLSGE